MDALSKIFEDIHLNHSEYLYLQAKGNWAFHSPAQPVLMAHIVLFGEAHLQFNNGTHVRLNTGDMFLIPAGLAHEVRHHQNRLRVESLNIAPLFDGLKQEAIEFGEGQAKNKTLILSVRCQLNAIMAKPLVNALPPYIHIQNALSDQAPEWLRIGI